MKKITLSAAQELAATDFSPSWIIADDRGDRFHSASFYDALYLINTTDSLKNPSLILRLYNGESFVVDHTTPAKKLVVNDNAPVTLRVLPPEVDNRHHDKMIADIGDQYPQLIINEIVNRNSHAKKTSERGHWAFDREWMIEDTIARLPGWARWKIIRTYQEQNFEGDYGNG